MGILDVFSDFVEAVTPWSVVEAEAPADDSKVRTMWLIFDHFPLPGQGVGRRLSGVGCRVDMGNMD